jgi:hypothetical protein
MARNVLELWRKMLRRGASGFTCHPKEGVLRIFIAFKNPSPWPGFNQRPLGPVAFTLTTTPPRRLGVLYVMSKEKSWLDFTAFDRKFEFDVNVGRVAFGGIFLC